MRYLVQELGRGIPRSALDASRFELVPAGEELTQRYRGDHVGVHHQRQEGLFYVGCSVPVGRMHGIELIEVARLPKPTGRNRPHRRRPELRPHRRGRGTSRPPPPEPLLEKYSPFPGPFERGVVACTGSEFCRFAIVETKERRSSGHGGWTSSSPLMTPRVRRQRPAAVPVALGVLAPTKGDPHALLGLFRFVRTAPDR